MSSIWEDAVRFHRDGNFAEAEQLYNQVLQDAKNAEDKEAYEIALYHLARLAFDATDDHVSLRRYRKLLKIQEFNGDSRAISRTCRHIAEIYQRKEAFEEAIKWAEKAWSIVETEWIREQMGASAHLLGILYQEAGNDAKAVSSLRSAQAIWEEIGKTGALHQTTAVLADILEEQEKYQPATRELRKLLKMLNPREDVEEIAEIHFRTGHLFLRLNDVKSALIHMLACLGRHGVTDSPLLERDASEVQKLRIMMGEEQFWKIVNPRLGEEGSAHLREMLAQFFPPASIDVVETAEESIEIPESEEPEPSEETELEPDSTPEELASEDFSRTQEVSQVPENSQSKPPPVVVDWDKEDVERTENSLFVQETDPAFQLTDVTKSKIKLAEYEVKNNFYRHFAASFLGVLLALLLVQWIFL